MRWVNHPLLLLLQILLAAQSSGWAEEISFSAEQGVITTQGLNFNCQYFQQNDEESCELIIGRKNALMLCRKVLDYLLVNALQRENGQLPTLKELRGYLLSDYPRSSKRTEAVLVLLVGKDGGENVLLEISSKLFISDLEAVRKVISTEKLSHDALERLWEQVLFKEPEVKGVIWAAIFPRGVGKTMDDLLVEVFSLPTAEGIQLLEVLERELRAKDAKTADSLSVVRRLIDECSSETVLSGGCQLPEQEGLLPVAVNHLWQIRLEQQLLGLRERKLPAAQLLEAVALMPYRQYRSEKMHLMVRNALRQVMVENRADPVEKIFTVKSLELVRYFSLYDREVAEWLDENLSETDVQDLASSEGRRDSQGIRWDYRKLKLGLAGLVAGLVVVGVLYFRLRKRFCSRQVQDLADVLSSDEREELRTLRKFFALAPRGGLKDLNRVYRLRSKEVHPDICPGGENDFALLHAKYCRAKELLCRLYSN